MVPPTWLLDILAAFMLVVATLSATRLAAAWLPSSWLSAPRPAGSLSWLHGPVGPDTDIAHLLMGIAMAGMLAASVKTLPPRAWEAAFGVLTAWFAWRVARVARVNGVRSLASGHCALPLFHCATMVYMFAALTTSDGMDMTRMGSGSLEYPALALALTLMLGCYSVWELVQLSGRRYSRGVAASADDTAGLVASDATLSPRALPSAGMMACRIAMGVTMAFMLLIMI